MQVIMFMYYILSIGLICGLIWNFIKEKESIADMLLYLVVAVPFVLRVLRVK